MLGAGGLGVAGLGLTFWPELDRSGATLADLKGMGLAVLGTSLFSLGNMISLRHSNGGSSP
ncbi:hypothetical protein D0544_10285 [Aestuariirhabdus litorea]|uniref:Uncharacterized protein n=1 Tax=Aestuariirhabdus litorea TaxID=2528527 RepID=A0A3P3VIT4_9GAMM|nr:hypothetical protein D0544_10285 [Aestuariirhabdus litorea]